MSEQQFFAFVLMPFDKGFDDVYKLGIKAAAIELGIQAQRVDEQTYSETILERIYGQIVQADFIVADMTGRNANVFYEVGYAHAKNKLTTLITSRVDDIPFDLKHHRHLVYETSIANLKAQLNDEFKWLKAETIKRRQKPITSRVKSSTGRLRVEDIFARAELELELYLQNLTKDSSAEIEALYLFSSAGWKFKNGAELSPSQTANHQDYELQHFIRSPVPRLSPGAWVPLKLHGEKTVWRSWEGEQLQKKYHMSGRLLVQIVTNKGIIDEELTIEVDFDDLPF